MTSQQWDLSESGPGDAATTVLLFAGGLCGTTFFDDVAAALRDAPVRLVVATLPGFAGSRPPAEASMEHYAVLAGELATQTGADIVGGHSLGANVALEMAAADVHRAPLLLLSPSFSREDEVGSLGTLSRLGQLPVAGALLWRLALAAIPRSLSKAIPAPRRKQLGASLASNDPAFCRRILPAYFAYLDAHGSVARRLCMSGVRATVAFGDADEIGLTAAERATLEACEDVEIVTVAGATHMLLVEQPRATADLLLALAG
jgi:pimeloyl-ACP methyl ester carboxylesterase